jgi:hypothetical protein
MVEASDNEEARRGGPGDDARVSLGVAWEWRHKRI